MPIEVMYYLLKVSSAWLVWLSLWIIVKAEFIFKIDLSAIIVYIYILFWDTLYSLKKKKEWYFHHDIFRHLQVINLSQTVPITHIHLRIELSLCKPRIYLPEKKTWWSVITWRIALLLDGITMCLQRCRGLWNTMIDKVTQI